MSQEIEGLLKYLNIISIDFIIVFINFAKNSFNMDETSRQKLRPKNNLLLIQIEDAVFQWGLIAKEKIEKVNNNFKLKMQEFAIPKGQFIGVTGEKKSGKTTLLNSIIGHTNVLKGNVLMRGTQIFFPKIPFVHPGSVKSNIVMESEFDELT